MRKWVIFSDFPGFGYAKVSKSTYRSWESMIDAYITKNPLIHRVTWILDIRRDPDVLDKTVLEWIRHIQIPFSIILTKSDKENRSFGLGKKDKLRKEFQTNDIFIFSAKDGYGSEEVLSHLFTTFI